MKKREISKEVASWTSLLTKTRHAWNSSKEYAEAGVKEYWIVTPIGKTVEVYYNHDGRFDIDAVYTDFSDHDLERMDDDDRKDVRLEIPVSLYEDFFVKVRDIFVNTDGFQKN